jgi:putative inorganic carbon (hco3(-)) transporter
VVNRFFSLETFLDLRRIDWIEGTLLVVAAPFLVFPSVKPVGTLMALLLVVIAWVARWIVDGRPWRVTAFNGALLLWSVMVAVGTLVTAFPEVTLPKATGLILGLAVFRYLVHMLHGPHQLRLAVVGLIVVGIVITLAGIVSVQWPEKVPFITQTFRFSIPRLLELPGGKESGISANQFGGTLVLFFSLLLSGILSVLQTRGKIVRLVFLGVSDVAVLLLILLTQSRSAWLGTVFGGLLVLALWGAFSATRTWRYVLWGICLLTLVVMAGGTWWIGPERMQQLWQEPAGMTALGNLGTLGFRQEVWRWALVATQDFPFTGCGLGTFREVVRLLYPLNVSPDYDIAHAHNIFLQVALDLGFPGLIAYLALLGIAAYVGLRVARRVPEWRGLALGLVGALGCLHIYGLLDALAPGSKTAIVFWVALGLLAALEQMAVDA